MAPIDIQEIGGVLRNRRKLFLRVAGLIALTAAILFAQIDRSQCRTQSQGQSAVGAAAVFEFEAASIKPNKSDGDGFGIKNPRDEFIGTHITVFMLIQYAYGIFEPYRIVGLPSWVDSERYDVEAKLNSSVADELQKLGKEQRILVWRQMLQALLASRFHLTAHRDTRDSSVYLLVIAKNGPKLRESPPDTDGSKHAVWGGTVRKGSTTLTAQQMPMEELASRLSNERSLGLGRIILDRTGLVAHYDFTLQFDPDYGTAGGAPDNQGAPTASDPIAPSIFRALHEQLGLKLEPGKGPVEFVVIDHVERPSVN